MSDSVTKKLFVETHGCQMNEYDSEKIKDILESKQNLSQTSLPENADLIVLNTCSVREKAEIKLFSDLGRYRKLKEANPHIKIAVGGCVASQEGDEIIRRAPYVDAVFGPQTLHRLPELINLREVTGKPQIDISFPEIEKFDSLNSIKNSCNKISSFLTIQEGCNKFCKFCVVPYTRGAEYSRSIKELSETNRGSGGFGSTGV